MPALNLAFQKFARRGQSGQAPIRTRSGRTGAPRREPAFLVRPPPGSALLPAPRSLAGCLFQPRLAPQLQACPRGRGAQTTGIDTATDTGTAGTQNEIKTETGAPADRGLRSKHGVEAGAQTGMDTETLCAAGEGDSTRILRRSGGASTMNAKKNCAPPRKTPPLIVCQRATVLRCLQPPQHC